MRWKRPETARRAYIRLLSERAGIQESAAPEDRDSALYSELIDAGYLRGVPFRDAAKGGMTTGVTVTEITLKGHLFLQQLKSEERRQSFLGRLKKVGLLIGGYLLGNFQPGANGLGKSTASLEAMTGLTRRCSRPLPGVSFRFQFARTFFISSPARCQAQRLSLLSLDLMTLPRTFAIVLIALSSFARAADDAAILDGPNYSFSIRAPDGWHMTSTRQLQAAFYPADKTFESTPVIMYVRSTDKAQLHVNNIEELNKFDLRGIQEHHPNAESKKVGSARLSDGKEIPIYSFSGGGYFERVAYAEQSKTITVFVASAEKKDDLKSSEKAFRELVASYLFISDNVTTPNHP